MNMAFLSDNTAPVDIRILNAVSEANAGFEKSYGNDRYTAEAAELAKIQFGERAEFYPVLTGTGANVTALASVIMPFQSVVCAESAHINVDECGAPERFLGSKIIGLKTADGKITPDDIAPCLHSVGFEHHSQPRVISVSQTTETGLVYTRDELANLSGFARANSMLLHVDGSRLANAAVSLGCSLGEAAAGADIVSLGGTKNGMLMGEAVVVVNPEAGDYTRYVRKQAMQLFSKMRYISAQYIPYLRDGIWRENAAHANSMAKMLADGLSAKGFPAAYPVLGNGVFVCLDKAAAERIAEKFAFYIWDEACNMARFMCSFATESEDVENLLKCI
jgi:threonine aldolase